MNGCPSWGRIVQTSAENAQIDGERNQGRQILHVSGSQALVSMDLLNLWTWQYYHLRIQGRTEMSGVR